VVLADFGLAGKVRPCVAVSIRQADSQRNMSIVVPMTTQIRGGECEVHFERPRWLGRDSVVNVLGVAGLDNARITSRLGRFPQESFDQVIDLLANARPGHPRRSELNNAARFAPGLAAGDEVKPGQPAQFIAAESLFGVEEADRRFPHRAEGNHFRGLIPDLGDLGVDQVRGHAD